MKTKTRESNKRKVQLVKDLNCSKGTDKIVPGKLRAVCPFPPTVLAQSSENRGFNDVINDSYFWISFFERINEKKYERRQQT